MMTKTTIGQLVADLFATYEHRYHDEALAALATQVTFDDLINLHGHRDPAPRPTRR